mmetsp:Transcript_12121/g.34737  ORF Transcript_12121/g.34737 Transcript_12121/m.34737 type:complete len:226 (+) Transcript_12121:193-870(+)
MIWRAMAACSLAPRSAVAPLGWEEAADDHSESPASARGNSSASCLARPANWKRLPADDAVKLKGSRITRPSCLRANSASLAKMGPRRASRRERITSAKCAQSSPEPQLGGPSNSRTMATRATSCATKALARSTASIGACSRPGSQRSGASFNNDWMDKRTLRKELVGVQPGPCHVPKMLRQTLPSVYSCGWSLKVPPSVFMNFTSGGRIGYSGGILTRKCSMAPS